MEGLLSVLGTGAAGLLALAAAVACWEHRHRRRHEAWSATVLCDPPPAPPPLAQVDIDLATIEPPDPDRRLRESTFDAAIDAMVNGPAAAAPLPWVETRPMVQAGLAQTQTPAH